MNPQIIPKKKQSIAISCISIPQRFQSSDKHKNSDTSNGSANEKNKNDQPEVVVHVSLLFDDTRLACLDLSVNDVQSLLKLRDGADLKLRVMHLIRLVDIH